MSEQCKLWVNGNEIEVDAERKLIDVLRNDLRLKSVKDGCSEGACGTCTVIIDGKAMKCCVQKCGRLAGKHVITVEGMKADKAPDVEAIIVEKPGVDVAFGAIGIGEITSIPTAPAVAGAYYAFNKQFQTSLPLQGTPYKK